MSPNKFGNFFRAQLERCAPGTEQTGDLVTADRTYQEVWAETLPLRENVAKYDGYVFFLEPPEPGSNVQCACKIESGHLRVPNEEARKQLVSSSEDTAIKIEYIAFIKSERLRDVEDQLMFAVPEKLPDAYPIPLAANQKYWTEPGEGKGIVIGLAKKRFICGPIVKVESPGVNSRENK